MKTLRNSIMTILASATILGATSASALPLGWTDSLLAWSSTASSCSVDESSASKYEFSGTQFRYLGTNVSSVSTGTFSFIQPITVRCNVAPVHDYVPGIPGTSTTFPIPASWVSPKWNSLIVGYKDTDGISNKARVTATLRRVARSTLGEATIAVFDSNAFPSILQQEEVKQFNHTFDFQKNEYYVEINLYRTDTTVTTPIAYSVRLTNGSVIDIPK